MQSKIKIRNKNNRNIHNMYRTFITDQQIQHNRDGITALHQLAETK
jgi:hypothetical protein